MAGGGDAPSRERAIRTDEVPAVSVILPTRHGGALLTRTLEAIRAQRWPSTVEIVALDSGSSRAELEALREHAARVVSVEPSEFDHGLTRDLGAARSRGEVLVFLNQDAVPADGDWLRRLVEPLASDDPPAAVQGGIREWPLEEVGEIGLRRFYWDSCGPRFYFTSESEGWIARHGGLGFSTVNCAIARWAWEELPFGRMPILEDKKWQRGASERGWRIVAAPAAAVWHTHDYGVPSLWRRCLSEGYGWRLVGERYPVRAAFLDLRHAETWREWTRGRRSASGLTPAELLFPLLRPAALWWGNHLARRVRH